MKCIIRGFHLVFNNNQNERSLAAVFHPVIDLFDSLIFNNIPRYQYFIIQFPDFKLIKVQKTLTIPLFPYFRLLDLIISYLLFNIIYLFKKSIVIFNLAIVLPLFLGFLLIVISLALLYPKILINISLQSLYRLCYRNPQLLYNLYYNSLPEVSYNETAKALKYHSYIQVIGKSSIKQGLCY